MPSSYAILGATGHTGRALFAQLSASKENTLHLYCRSKDKLLEQNPLLSALPSNIKFFIGALSEKSIITSCISGVDTVFCVVATNDPTPGCQIAQDTAAAVLASMEELRSTQSTLPHLIFLSAAPVSNVFKKDIPSFISWALWRGIGIVYRDLEAAETRVRKEKGWVRATFVYPGGLSSVEDRVLGHKVSTESAGSGFLGYGDLAAGMIEIADEKSGRYDWVDVSVVATGKGVKIAYGSVIGMLVRGIIFGG